MAASSLGQMMEMNEDIKPPKDPPDLSSDDWAKIFIYSSRDVEKALISAQDQAHWARASLKGRDGNYEETSLSGLNAVLTVQRLISDETKTGDRARPRKRPFVLSAN